MSATIKQYPAINPNPLLSVAKNGTILFSNEAAEPLLNEWCLIVSEKLPLRIREIVQRVLCLNNPMKMEVKAGDRVYLVVFSPFPNQDIVNISGFDINDNKELEAQLHEAHEQILIQSEELQTSNEELQIFNVELQTCNEELQVQSDELNKANALLHDSVIGFRTLAENSPDLIARFDRQNRCLYANSAAKFYDIPLIAEFYGWSVNELNDKTKSEMEINPEIAKFSEKQREKVFITGKPETVEFQDTSFRGKKCYFDTKIVPEFVNGEVSSVLVVSRDITEREEVEEKLRESEEKYRNIVEMANEGIFVMNAETIVTYANKRTAEVLGYTLEEIIGRLIWDFISDESKPIADRSLEKRRRGINESYELRLICKDGSPLWAFISAKPFFNKDGEFTGSLCMLTDITKRKEAEEALRNFEIARKKEIHHRIKNNLQVIYSLLDLQAEMFKGRNDIRDLEVLNAFKESMNRVLSIALIHEELYKGENFDALNFSQHIKELANNIVLTYRLKTDVRLNFDLEESLFFDIDIAIPLGIIINELVSNSLKYAFPDREKGEIQIKLRKNENVESKSDDIKSDSFFLIVSDNGVGVPENLDIEQLDSLGLQLVTTIVKQLDGELELKRNSGTEFIIRFTVTERIAMHHSRELKGFR